MRVRVFIDGANLYYIQKELRTDVDIVKLTSHCGETFNGKVASSCYYSGWDGSPEQKRFFYSLERQGVAVRIKPIKTSHSANGGAASKANMDVEMAVDAISGMDDYDAAVFVSGDGDFEYLYEFLSRQGKELKIVGLGKMTAIDIKEKYTFEDLESIIDEVRKEE